MIVIGRDLSGRAGEGDRQLTARVDIPEQHIGCGRPAFLPRVPGFQDGRDMLRGELDAGRAPLDQEQDNGFTGGVYGPQQLFLPARQVQAVPVAQVGRGPALAAGLLVIAQHQQHNIGFAGRFHGPGNELRVAPGIVQPGIVVEPHLSRIVAGLSDTAALGIQHFDRLSHFLADALQDRKTSARMTAVSPQPERRGVGADHRQRAELAPIERQEPALVLQQDDGPPRRFKRQGTMLIAVGDGQGCSLVYKGILEQAKLELDAQDLRHGFIHPFHGDVSSLNRPFQVAEAATQLHVHAAGKGLDRGIALAGSDPVQAVQIVHAPAIGDDEALEAPFAAQQVLQQPGVDMRRHTVDLIVGSHHRANPAFAHNGFEGGK